MHDVRSFMSRYRYTLSYMALMLGRGVWQLLDWYHGTEDPIWHLFFYLLFMPAFSLAHGRIAPFMAAFLTVFVYLFMANGGSSIEDLRMTDFISASELCVPSVIAASIGVIVRKIVSGPPQDRDDRSR